jgi:hypothetical protein
VRLRRNLIASVVLVAALTAGLVWRARDVEKQRRTALEGVVEAEALALRLGDENKFMLYQGPVEQWRTQQRRRFDKFQQSSVEIMVSGEIAGMDVSGDEARVEVRVLINGTTDSAVWLYEYTQNGWRHVATESEPWTPTPHETEFFTYSYYSDSAALAHSVDSLLQAWWRKADQRVHLIGKPPHVEVSFDPDAESMEWGDDTYTHLIIPTRSGDGTPITALDADDLTTLAQLAAQYWVDTATNGNLEGYDQWATDELHLWFAHEFEPSLMPASPLFDPLMQIFGSNLISGFTREVRDDDDMPTHVALRQAMIDNAPDDLEGEELRQYAFAYLRAEAALSQHFLQTETADRPGARFGTIFMDRERDSSERMVQLNLIEGLDTSSLEILDTVIFGDVLWVRASYLYGYSWTGQTLTERVIMFIPFRKNDGYWVHTWAMPKDWGERQVEAGELLSLEYYALDAPFASGLQPELEALYGVLADDFGIEAPSSITAKVEMDFFNNRDIFEAAIVPIAPSPHAFIVPADLDERDYVRYSLETALIYGIFSYQMGSEPYPELGPLSSALIDWEVQRRTDTYGDVLPWTAMEPVKGAAVPMTLDDLWGGQLAWSDESDQFTLVAKVNGSRILIEMLIERFGEDRFGEMVRALKDADNMNQWLEQSVGIMAHEIETEWWERFRTWLDDTGYDWDSQPPP